MELSLIEKIIKEGVIKDQEGYKFDFNDTTDNDILSLKFKPKKNTIKKIDNTTYSYYYAYQLDKSELSGDLLKAIKSLDQSIEQNSIKLFVNKAVMGFFKSYGSNFDTIITPKSSSLVLSEVANQLKDKIGNINMFDEAFIKTLNTNIQFDKEKVDKLPETHKKQFMKVFNNIINSDKPFKMKEVYPPYRKFIKDFITFNSDNDRKLNNAINNKNIILIDDYKTTGTTLKEMLLKLIQAGAANITIFILLKIN